MSAQHGYGAKFSAWRRQRQVAAARRRNNVRIETCFRLASAAACFGPCPAAQNQSVNQPRWTAVITGPSPDRHKTEAGIEPASRIVIGGNLQHEQLDDESLAARYSLAFEDIWDRATPHAEYVI